MLRNLNFSKLGPLNNAYHGTIYKSTRFSNRAGAVAGRAPTIFKRKRAQRDRAALKRAVGALILMVHNVFQSHLEVSEHVFDIIYILSCF